RMQNMENRVESMVSQSESLEESVGVISRRLFELGRAMTPLLLAIEANCDRLSGHLAALESKVDAQGKKLAVLDEHTRLLDEHTRQIANINGVITEILVRLHERGNGDD
ncbi:MAG TPA: hypothetical protein V6D17_06825, partial [Candidatus Obscuribacterales bacterium]